MKTKFIALGLLLIGIMQMAGDLLHMPILKGIGAASQASPAMKVFTNQNGFETFSSKFHIHYLDRYHVQHTVTLTPSVYKGLHGPYNRRNVYGAAIAYAPILASNPLTRAMHQDVIHAAFCQNDYLLRALGIPAIANKQLITIELEPRLASLKKGNWPLTFEVNCDA